MAVTTYAQLQTAVADWLHRDDLEAKIPDFISLAEARLNDMLLLRDMEDEATLSTVADSNVVALPTGYVSPLAMWLSINSIRQLLYPALPQEMPYSPNSALPQYWAIDGDNILLDCPSQGVQTLYFRFIKKSNLSDANPTNYLLTKRPDVYLFATLVEAAVYTQDQENLAIWLPKFDGAAKGLMDAENRARGMVPLRTEFPQLQRARFDVYRGY